MWKLLYHLASPKFFYAFAGRIIPGLAPGRAHYFGSWSHLGLGLYAA